MKVATGETAGNLTAGGTVSAGDVDNCLQTLAESSMRLSA